MPWGSKETILLDSCKDNFFHVIYAKTQLLIQSFYWLWSHNVQYCMNWKLNAQLFEIATVVTKAMFVKFSITGVFIVLQNHMLDP